MKQAKTEFQKQVERSIAKTMRRSLWVPFITALKEYELIRAEDSICACISGGKDSMLMAKMLQMLQRNSDVPFGLRFLVMDPGYSPEDRGSIADNAERLGLPVEFLEKRIFGVVEEQNGKGAPCYLCARLRRGALYEKAREMGCNKIALGHHFNDVVETTLMGMFYSSQLQAMMPKLHSQHFAGMELIRPLYCVHEEDIISWADANGLSFLHCACPLSREGGGCDSGSQGKRAEVKQLLGKLKQQDPDIEKSIFNSLHTVCLDTFPGYKEKGTMHSFLDYYDD